jgi:hypothetical protein
MPKGTAYDVETITFTEKELKKVSETARESILTPAAGKRFRLLGFTLVADAAVNLVFEDGTTAFLVVPLGTAAVTPYTLPSSGYISTTPANKLQIKIQEATKKITGTIFYIEDVL